MAVYEITTDKGVYQIETEDTISSMSDTLIKPQAGVNRITPFLPKEKEVESRILQRKDSVDLVREEAAVPFDFQKRPMQSFLKPAVMGAKVAAVPFQRAESTVAGLGLGLQKGKPLESLKMAKEGLLGRKKYELGDIIRTTGFGGKYNEQISSAVGFTASMVAPAKALKDGMKLMGKIQRFSDKGLKNAGQKLVSGSDEAVKIIGGRLDKAYAPINTAKVNPDKVLNEFSKLPPSVIQHIETEIGQNLDDMLSDFNVEKARKLKQVLGKLKPGSYGKKQRGVTELVIDEQVNRAYASVKQSMQEGLINSGFKKQANVLLEADEAFHETKNASDYIRKTIMEPTLRKPTKAGRAASKLGILEDISAREALNTLKSAGGHARNNINKAVIELEKFNRLKASLGILGGAGRAVVYGGVAGQAAGKIMGQQD